jgi:hypothetical protein
MQDAGVAVLLMDAGSSKLEDFSAHLFEWAEIEEFLAIVAEISFSAIAALHAIRSGQFPRGCVMHHQVVADKIEAVAIETSPGRTVESLPKLAIKNQIAQPLALDDIFECLCHPHAKEVGGGKWISAVVHQDSGRWHEPSFK